VKKENQLPKFTYEDWSTGKIAIGGIQINDLGVPLIPFVNWQQIEADSLVQIKHQQKLIFLNTVEDRFDQMVSGIKKLYDTSSDKTAFIQLTLNDLDSLFKVKCNSTLHLRFLNRTFGMQEVRRIQNFYVEQILRGNRHYDFIQSPNQNSLTFRNPPIEVEAEIFFRCYQFIRNELGYSKLKLTLQEIALVCIYQDKIITRKNAAIILKDFEHR